MSDNEKEKTLLELQEEIDEVYENYQQYRGTKVANELRERYYELAKEYNTRAGHKMYKEHI